MLIKNLLTEENLITWSRAYMVIRSHIEESNLYSVKNRVLLYNNALLCRGNYKIT